MIAMETMDQKHHHSLRDFVTASARLVGWSLTSLFSTNTAISETSERKG